MPYLKLKKSTQKGKKNKNIFICAGTSDKKADKIPYKYRSSYIATLKLVLNDQIYT